jgi:hypothetical protein
VFKPTFVERFTKEVVLLINSEEIPLHFGFEESIKYAESSIISVHPSSGVVPPKSDAPIEIRFQPVNENIFRQSLTCHVKKKTHALKLQVRGEGVYSAESISCTRTDGLKVELTTKGENVLPFGRVFLNTNHDSVVSITNEGKTAFDFKWVWSKPTPTSIKVQGFELMDRFSSPGPEGNSQRIHQVAELKSTRFREANRASISDR